MTSKKRKVFSGALAFILLMGIVSMFSDMTHEGGRSIVGEYLSLNNASTAVIGFVSGFFRGADFGDCVLLCVYEG